MTQSFRTWALAGLPLALIACSQEPVETADDGDATSESVEKAAPAPAAETTRKTMAEATEPKAQPVKPDWTGLDDPAVESKIDARLAAFAKKTGEKINMFTVSSFPGDTRDERWAKAGEAAFAYGTPVIAVADEQREVHLVGDEALAYDTQTSRRIEKETAAYFDRGEFDAGVDHALNEIAASWQGD